MKSTGVGAVLIAIGIVFLYMTVTNKLDCFKGAFKCAFLDDRSGATKTQDGGAGGVRRTPSSSRQSGLPSLPRLPQLGI
jgi:hypothetical protein